MKRISIFNDSRAILYIVATPIGNLEEMTPRAIKILNEVDVIACEDTRLSGRLLAHFKIKKNLISCHEHNESQAAQSIINMLLEDKKVAYISDAGLPGISDPGQRLVNLALENEIKVSIISGPSALLNALIGSGLDSDHFYFHGFLLSKEKARVAELQSLYKRRETLIFYEAPHRIIATLNNMFEVFGPRKACIARELTKVHEEFIYGNLDELTNLDPKTLIGEMVIVVEGNRDELSIDVGDDEIIKLVESLTSMGISTKDAIKQASILLKINKNYIYKLLHRV
jgi:16S rRNA (cytidine1402-2'-O)-methyltransferase